MCPASGDQDEAGLLHQQPELPKESAFESAFGALGLHPQAKHGDSMDVDMDPSRPRWQQLFDAPSHALPAPTALAQAFLRLVTTE